MRKKLKFGGFFLTICLLTLYFSPVKLYITQSFCNEKTQSDTPKKSNKISSAELHGRWYLYIGHDINSDKNLLQNLSFKDYMDISGNVIHDYNRNNKDGAAAFEIKGDKLYIGDAIYNFKITNIGENKVLILKLIGNSISGSDEYFEGGTTSEYVLSLAPIK